ncbi:LuxR C-terminal-related transcriptional regulator [Bordetella tumulicola]|uniref:helix-turn-helix transcriptional regulator n=1 Tax=Bordetella tumulicola TaxID=1649133 RepID=UPI0039EF3591
MPTPTGVWAPQRLVDALGRLPDRRCIVLTGPAASGKTLLLQTWAGRLRSNGAAVIWVQGSELSPLGLVSTLVQRCVALDPAIASLFPNPFPSDHGEAMSYLSVALVRAAATWRQPIVIVFDNLHALRHPEELRVLQPLLDYCPAGLQCVFAGREPPALSLGRLRAYGNVLEVDPGDLQWTPDEIRDWAKACLDIVPARIEADWHAVSAGWCGGLHFLLRAYQRDQSAIHDGPSRLPQEALAYLQHQVLERLHPEDVRRLTLLSILEDVDAELCAALCTMAVDDCVAMLQRWRAEIGFVSNQTGPYGVAEWRLQAPLKALLSMHFSRLDEREQAKVHRAASNEFARRGQRVRAVVHAVVCGDMDHAAAMVERYAGELFRIGDWRQLSDVILQCSPEHVAVRPGLRVWRALLALLQHRFDDCRGELDMLDGAKDGFDASVRYRILVIRGLLAVHSDDMGLAMELFPHLQVPPPHVEDIALAGGRNVLSWIHIYRNEYAQARAIQAGQERGRAPMSTPFGVLTGRCMVGFSLALEGQMTAAEHLYRDVLYECEKRDEAAADTLGLATGLLCEVLYELGNLDEVLLLRSRLREFERLAWPDTLLRVMLVLSRTLALKGKMQEALVVVRRLDGYARQRGLDRLLSYGLLEQFRLHLRCGHGPQADACWNEIGVLRAKHAEVESSVLSEISVVADRADILRCLHEGRLLDARGKILVLLDVCVQRGRNRRVAALYFQLGAIERAMGNLRAAHEATVKGLEIGHRLGLVRSLLDAHPDVPELAALALNSRVLDPLLVFQADRLRAVAGAGPLAQAAIGGMTGAEAARPSGRLPAMQLTDREREVVRLLTLALPNKKIARELGLSPETVKWHLSNIYSKLGVATRDEVVARMRE